MISKTFLTEGQKITDTDAQNRVVQIVKIYDTLEQHPDAHFLTKDKIKKLLQRFNHHAKTLLHSGDKQQKRAAHFLLYDTSRLDQDAVTCQRDDLDYNGLFDLRVSVKTRLSHGRYSETVNGPV